MVAAHESSHACLARSVARIVAAQGIRVSLLARIPPYAAAIRGRDRQRLACGVAGERAEQLAGAFVDVLDGLRPVDAPKDSQSFITR